MALLAPFWLAELHREVYVAIYRSWVPHGQRGDYGRKAGVSREYLSNLFALDPPVGRRVSTHRLPSPRTARRLADALPAPPEFRESLFEHMRLAHKERHAGHASIQAFVEQRRVSELLAALAAGHGQATFGADVHQTERAYRGLRAAAAGVLAQLSPELYPASYVQTCLYLHDAQCVLDRADDALFYARLGQLVLTASDGYEAGFSRPQVDDLLINAIRGEGVAYHNLGLERQVLVSCEQAQTTSAFRNAGDFWQPLVGRDRLNALANTPRFGRRDARALAHGLMTLCEQTGDAFTLYLVRDGWLRCLVQSEDWREAHRVLQAELDLLPRLPYVGPLHRALLFKTAAHLAWRQGDQAGWREHVRDFVRLARAAGLKHQLRLVRGLYGPALGAITEYLDVEPATSAYP